ncbi:hypothetical protein SAMN04487902_1015 [Prevotella sp. ne3005]|uniref:DUF5677 domain-containing protein n=1 Tax=Prevotella sp. ne3005 TaxID=1761887 RepID=UPI0008C914A0|nr:DUF5677 domain-containing protein [Prevotella sp. ne3005]SEM46253.1 hypothetical protein SAMN04487902_1015 [Prevotella sp. ne3005]
MGSDSVNFIFTIDFDLDVIDKKLWHTFCLWREYNMKKLTAVDNISQCLLQMMLLRVRSLKQMLYGVPLYLEKPELRKVLDISSMAAVVRGIYETAFIYHNIFITTENDDERDILILIWKIKGLNNTQGAMPPDGQEVHQRQDAATIAEYKRKASEIADRMNISANARKVLDEIIDDTDSNLRGYIFEKDEEGRTIKIHRKNFSKPAALFGHDMYSYLYSYMSIFSHPSYLGMTNYADMFNNGKDRENANILLQTTCICVSKFISDFCEAIPNGKKIWKEINPTPLSLLDICNNL